MKKNLSVLALGLFLCGTPLVAQYSIYPAPQSVNVSDDLHLYLGKGVQIISDKYTDPVAKEALSQLLHKNGISVGNKGVKIKFMIHKSKKLNDPKSMLNVSGSYSISVSKKGVELAGFDGTGLYYAVQTLRQILVTKALPMGTIFDAPALPYRGVVEGFYGTPWSHRDRIAQLEFYGQLKMNTYIYGPKDDPYHSSPNWRKPYPKDESDRIRELVEISKRNKVNFVWAIHPGKDIQWNDEDYVNLKNKFEAMYALGVRSFAFFFDDISGEGTRADRQAELLNRINKEFIQVKKDCTPLVMCPTEYNKSWSDPKPDTYLDILGTKLDKSIEIMWTGDRVCADINNSTLDWINVRIKRPAYIWWNFPVSDYVRNHLLMGPAYGNELDIQNKLAGFVSNPMEHAESSKLALFGVANYTWNLKQYDYLKTWRAAISYVMPEAAKELEIFATHNADLGPNGHGYRRDESWNMKKPVSELLSAYEKGESLPQEACQNVKNEFSLLENAPKIIREKASNKYLVEEMNPWLDQTELLGKKGSLATQLIALNPLKNPALAWSQLNELFQMERQSSVINMKYNQNPYQPGVKSGTLVMQPFVNQVSGHTADLIYTSLTGAPKAVTEPFTSYRNIDGWEQGITLDTTKYLYIKELQKEGDWFGLDLGMITDVKEIIIRQGRNSKDHDIMHTASLEYSVDSKNWTVLQDNLVERYNIRTIFVEPIRARYVRLVCKKVGSTIDPNRKNNWSAFRTFEVNPIMRSTQLLSNITQLSKQPVRAEKGRYDISPSLEYTKILPEAYIGLEFPTKGEIQNVTVDFGSVDAQKKMIQETSVDGITWEQGSSKPVKMIRYRNNSSSPVEVKLTRFSVEIPTDPRLWVYDLTDGDLTTSFATSLPFSVYNPNTIEVLEKLVKKSKNKVAKKTIVSPSGKLTILGNGNLKVCKVMAVMNDQTCMNVELNIVNDFFATADLPENVISVVFTPIAEVSIAEIIWKNK